MCETTSALKFASNRAEPGQFPRAKMFTVVWAGGPGGSHAAASSAAWRIMMWSSFKNIFMFNSFKMFVLIRLNQITASRNFAFISAVLPHLSWLDTYLHSTRITVKIIIIVLTIDSRWAEAISAIHFFELVYIKSKILHTFYINCNIFVLVYFFILSENLFKSAKDRDR